jgi:hypothetical protein
VNRKVFGYSLWIVFLLISNLAWVFIFSQPDKLRMPQVTIRRPFGELDLGNVGGVVKESRARC